MSLDEYLDPDLYFNEDVSECPKDCGGYGELAYGAMNGYVLKCDECGHRWFEPHPEYDWGESEPDIDPAEIYGARIIKVYCSKCQEWTDESTVEATNIEEGSFGEDRLTFNCPTCGTEQTSNRVGQC